MGRPEGLRAGRGAHCQPIIQDRGNGPTRVGSTKTTESQLNRRDLNESHEIQVQRDFWVKEAKVYICG